VALANDDDTLVGQDQAPGERCQHAEDPFVRLEEVMERGGDVCGESMHGSVPSGRDDARGST
jgi:hypothetical protein